MQCATTHNHDSRLQRVARHDDDRQPFNAQSCQNGNVELSTISPWRQN